MDRTDKVVKEQSAYIKSRQRVEDDKDSTINQQKEEIERLNENAIRGNEVVRTKEETIVSNNRTIEAMEAEISRLRIELNHSKIKIESLQRNIKDCNWKVERAQRDTNSAYEDRRKLQAELAGRRREERGNRDTQKRSIERSRSPPKKRHSPSPSPAAVPRNSPFMSPPRSPIAPRSPTPRGRSGGWQTPSPMRDIQRPISPIRRGQSVSPMRGESTLSPLSAPTPKNNPRVSSNTKERERQ